MEETWELSTWNQGRVGLRKIGSPNIIFIKWKLRVHIGRIRRLVQQLWQTKIYVKGGKAGNQGKKNQKCVNISRTYGERSVDMASQFSRYNFLVIDLFIVVAREQRRKNTKWRSMLVQGQTNMTDIVKDWQTKRLFKCLEEASSNWKKRVYGEKEILNSQRSAGRTNKTNMTDIGKDWQSGETRFSQEKNPYPGRSQRPPKDPKLPK